MRAFEVNFDSIIGPTHHYAGLARGNLASQENRHLVSNPREAALQGLAKMKRVMDLGILQAVLPPHDRPDVHTLRRLGFSGTDSAVLAAADQRDPALLSACGSASAMWAANAATVSPSADSADGRVHFTPANLASHLHRSLETSTTADILRAIFHDEQHFAHHAALPASLDTADEGAANHTRLSPGHAAKGLQIFTFGRDATEDSQTSHHFLPRQTRQASTSIARLHQLDDARVLFLRQHPHAIAAGVFHNDVIAVGNGNVFLCHERAYADPSAVRQIADGYERTCGEQLHMCIIPEKLLSLDAAVKSYLFNSQLLSMDDGMVLLAPADCRELPSAQAAIEMIQNALPLIRSVEFVDVRQSMRNGGGPACLRLRVVFTEKELAACHQGVLLTPLLYEKLCAWVQRHYRDRLISADLADSALLEESRCAVDELTGLLCLGSIHPFQRR